MSTKKPPRPSDQELTQLYNQQKQELQALVSKVGELEKDKDEHTLVIETLDEVQTLDPDRKCFRLIGGVLVESNVKDVLPALKGNVDGISRLVTTLTGQYEEKEKQFEQWKKEYNIQVVNQR
ncbi:Prefoldin beta-like protein [Atractiella rhizophila]|nr:Prefoldin beta-like protein [Atractiella rhizophila]